MGFSISIGTGILMSLGLYIFGEALVGVFAGSGGEAAKATLSRSLSYVRIRGAGSVPTLIMMVAQAACIGAKDAESPLIAICVVSVFNCFLGTHPALLIRRSRTRLGWNGPLHAATDMQIEANCTCVRAFTDGNAQPFNYITRTQTGCLWGLFGPALPAQHGQRASHRRLVLCICTSA